MMRALAIRVSSAAGRRLRPTPKTAIVDGREVPR